MSLISLSHMFQKSSLPLITSIQWSFPVFRGISTTPAVHDSIWNRSSNTAPHIRKLKFAEKLRRKTRLNPAVSSRIDAIAEDEALGEQVELSKDERVICCWHPEPKESWYKYENTKPITDDMRSQVLDVEQKLKVQGLRPVLELFRPKNERLVIRELMHITHTAKYGWYPHKRRIQRLQEANVLGIHSERYRQGL